MRNGSLNYLTNGGSAGLFREVLCQEINCHDVSVCTRTGNHRSSLWRHERMMTELLTTMYIRQVHLNHRKLSGLQRIV